MKILKYQTVGMMTVLGTAMLCTSASAAQERSPLSAKHAAPTLSREALANRKLGIVDKQAQTDPVDGGVAGTSCTYAVDDGTNDNQIGLTAGGDFAWGNHFTSAVACDQIEVIQVSWGLLTPGSPAQIYVLSDPNGDGNPSDAVTLATANVVTDAGGGNGPAVFVNYPIGPVPVGSSFFIATRVSHAPGQFPAQIDQTASQGQSWAAFGFSDPNSPFASGTVGTIDSFGLPGNWAVRAGGNPANECLIPLACPCNADIAPPGGNGTVDVSDLLAVIATWGQTGPPRPQGDCAPLPVGDCLVNV